MPRALAKGFHEPGPTTTVAFFSLPRVGLEQVNLVAIATTRQAHSFESRNDPLLIKPNPPKGIEKSVSKGTPVSLETARIVSACLSGLPTFQYPVRPKGRLPEEFLETVLERGLGLLRRTSDESRGCFRSDLICSIHFEQCFGLCIGIGHYTRRWKSTAESVNHSRPPFAWP